MISIDVDGGAHRLARSRRPTGAIRSSASPTASSRRGVAVAPPMPSAQAVQRPDASSATCAAADASAKSLRRALISWKPAPTRAFVPDRKADSP